MYIAGTGAELITSGMADNCFNQMSIHAPRQSWLSQIKAKRYV